MPSFTRPLQTVRCYQTQPPWLTHSLPGNRSPMYAFFHQKDTRSCLNHHAISIEWTYCIGRSITRRIKESKHKSFVTGEWGLSKLRYLLRKYQSVLKHSIAKTLKNRNAQERKSKISLCIPDFGYTWGARRYAHPFITSNVYLSYTIYFESSNILSIDNNFQIIRIGL